MNATLERPPNKGRQRAAQATRAAEPRPLSLTPAAAIQRLNDEVGMAIKTVEKAIQVAEADDTARMLHVAKVHCLSPMLLGLDADEDAVHVALDHWYDGNALLNAVAARHRQDAGGALAQEAVDVLAPLGVEMDRLDFWPAATLPVEAAQGSAKRPQPYEELDPHCVIMQAQDVARAAADEGATDVLWGVYSLVEKAAGKVDAAHSAAEAGVQSKELHDAASDELAGLLGIIHAVNDGGLNDRFLYAAETLVIVAKRLIDSANLSASA